MTRTRTVEVRCRTSGAPPAGDGCADGVPDILLDVVEERITVAELIRRTVHEHVRALAARHALEAEAIREAIARRWLTAEDVARQAAAGKVGLAARAPGEAPAPVDPQVEAERAVRAFARGAFVILVNGRQVTELEEPLAFADQTRVTFLRLVPLAGG